MKPTVASTVEAETTAAAIVAGGKDYAKGEDEDEDEEEDEDEYEDEEEEEDCGIGGKNKMVRLTAQPNFWCSTRKALSSLPDPVRCLSEILGQKHSPVFLTVSSVAFRKPRWPARWSTGKRISFKKLKERLELPRKDSYYWQEQT